MDKPCEICGDIGYVNALAICSKCKMTREHKYCMREMPEDDEENWVCEDCHSSNRIPSSKLAQSKHPCGAGMRFTLNKPRKSKVKYIEPEEAMGLVSGGLMNNSSSPSKHCPNKFPMKKPFFSKVKAFPSTAPSPKFSIKPNPSVVSSECRDPLHTSNMPNCSKDDNLLATTDGPERRHCEESLPTKRVTFGKLPKPGVSSGADCRTEAQRKNIDSKETESTNVMMVLDRYLPNHPAASPSWKGTFKINNFSSIDHIQAHPPCKVHKKAYNLSKNLPKLLQFEMLPRLNSRMEIFENDVTCELDIGLYFLPSFGYEQNCSSLIKYLNMHDLLLQSVVDEVELLISTSNHLPEDSHEMNQKHFLWGLFRPNETIQSQPVSEEIVSEDINVDMLGGQEVGGVDVVVPKPTDETIQSQPVSEEVVSEDMNVDMLGGQEVGSIDVIVPKPTNETIQSQPVSKEVISGDMNVDMLGGQEVGSVDVVVPKPTSDTIQSQPVSEEVVSEDMNVDMIAGEEVGSVDVVVSKPTSDNATREVGRGIEGEIDEVKLPPNCKARGAALDFSASKVKKELSYSMEEVCVEFERELQRSFDRITTLMQRKEASSHSVKMVLKKEFDA